MNPGKTQRPTHAGARELDNLQGVIAERRNGNIKSSHTARLLKRGTPRCARKLGEEAVELVVAALSGRREEVISESADLLYHWLVLLESLEIDAGEVYGELTSRRKDMKTHDDR